MYAHDLFGICDGLRGLMFLGGQAVISNPSQIRGFSCPWFFAGLLWSRGELRFRLGVGVFNGVGFIVLCSLSIPSWAWLRDISMQSSSDGFTGGGGSWVESSSRTGFTILMAKKTFWLA